MNKLIQKIIIFTIILGVSTLSVTPVFASTTKYSPKISKKGNTQKNLAFNNNLQLPNNNLPTLPATSNNLGALPAISNANANPGYNNAILSGNIDPNGSSANVYFEISNGVNSPIQTIAGQNQNPVSVTYTINGLASNTNYSFRIIAQNQTGIKYGNWISFTTLQAITTNPYISSISPSSVPEDSGSQTITIYGSNFINGQGAISARINGLARTTNFISANQLEIVLNASDVSNDGTAQISVKNPNGTISNNATLTITNVGGSSGGGSSGGGYVGPQVVTEGAYNITISSAMIKGLFNPNYQNVEVWFEYGTNPNLTNYSQTAHYSQNGTYQSLSFAKTITDLNPNTNYYFRLVVKNNYIVKKGNILSFTTLTPAPINNNTNYYNNNTNQTNNNEVDIAESEETIVEEISEEEFEEKFNLLGASAFGKNGFLPQTIFGWVMTILLILILIILSRITYHKFTKKKNQ